MIEWEKIEHQPQVYFAIMHVLSILAPPVNLYTVYCIVWKSTRQMGSFKWYLLLYQVTCMLFDFVFTTVTLPVIFFPLPMGYTGSWIAEKLNITVHATFLMVVPAIPCVSACIHSLFFYRLHIIAPHGNFFRKYDKGEYNTERFRLHISAKMAHFNIAWWEIHYFLLI